jgi:shikimate dehydrogenase
MKITGRTSVIVHIGYPTHAFKAPMIYNPYFSDAGVDAVVVPMACRADQLAGLLKPLLSLENVIGALVTMPLKVDIVGHLQASSPAVRIAGSCNAVRRDAQGCLVGDMFDGEGFVRGVRGKGFGPAGRRVLILGAGGVGSAIAASFAAAGVAELALFDLRADAADALASRLRTHYPQLVVLTGHKDPAGFDAVVNATPMGMNPGDELPVDVQRLSPQTFVGEVVMRSEMTAFLQAARDRGCPYQVGSDMLFEQIPAYLEFFGLPTTTPDHLRRVARLSY